MADHKSLNASVADRSSHDGQEIAHHEKNLGIPHVTNINTDRNGETEKGLPAGTSVQPGVSKVEAFNRMLYNSGGSGRSLLVVLVVSIGLTMFAYALD